MLALTVVAESFTIARLPADSPLPAWATRSALWSVTRTANELSIVCASGDVPADVRQERGWRALAVAGPLDFALTGILLSVAEPLAAAGVSIFALSTYDTDYVLVREGDLAGAIAALTDAGHNVAG